MYKNKRKARRLRLDRIAMLPFVLVIFTLEFISKVVMWIIVFTICALWMLTPFYWCMGDKGTYRVLCWLEKEWKAVDKVLLVLTLIALILLPYLASRIPSVPDLKGYNATIGTVTQAELTQMSNTTSNQAEKSPKSLESSQFEDFSEEDFNLLVLAVQHELGYDDDLFNVIQLQPDVNAEENNGYATYDLAQQVMAKIIVNQMRTFGYSSIRDTLSDEIQWGEMLPTILQALQTKNNSTANVDSVTGNVRFNLNDKRTRENVARVLSGQDGLPSNLLYERCTGYYEVSDNLLDAWADFQTYYNPDRVSCYVYAETQLGTWWICATDNAYFPNLI